MEAADAVSERCARVVEACGGPAREIVSIPRKTLLLILAMLDEEAAFQMRKSSWSPEDWILDEEMENDEWVYVKKEAWE